MTWKLLGLLGVTKPEPAKPSINYVTETELLGRLEALYAAHPGLREARERFDEDECSCCIRSDLGARFGWDVAGDLEATRFLLGCDS